MSGLSDYLSQQYNQYLAGVQPVVPVAGMAAISRYLALYTTAPTTDSGTSSGTEVSGTGYARVQVAGAVAATASFASTVSTITMTTNPGWVVPGMNVYDLTNAFQIGTVSTYSGTSLVLTANAAHASSGAADSLQFSAFNAAAASSGSEPATTPGTITNTNAVITFAQAGAGGWGTVTSLGLFDSLSGTTNLLAWDYLGNFKWLPFSCTSASPGVLTTDTAADAPANGASCVVTAKYGGTLPTTGGSWAGLLTSAGLSGATFNLGVNTTAIGGGQFRQVTQQSIPANITASFAAGTLIISAA